MTKRTLTTLLVLSAAFVLLGTNTQAATTGGKIKKCQDASGRWHYGDTADDECRQSKVEVLNQQGITTNEIAAPLTAQELKEQENNKASVEAKKKMAAEQARQDQLLLSTYGHEDDISFVRDRKIADTEAQIQSSQKTLTALHGSLERLQKQAKEEQRGGKPVPDATAKQIANTEAQIAKHEQYVAEKQKEIEAIRAQAAKDTERYRLLKRSRPSPTPSVTPTPNK
jgi:hypothetical protein